MQREVADAVVEVVPRGGDDGVRVVREPRRLHAVLAALRGLHLRAVLARVNVDALVVARREQELAVLGEVDRVLVGEVSPKSSAEKYIYPAYFTAIVLNSLHIDPNVVMVSISNI